MLRIVLQAQERYNGASYATHEARIAADRLVELDLDLISKSAGTMFRDILNPQALLGQVPGEMRRNATVYSVQSILSAMGAEDVDEMANVDQYGAEEETGIAERKPQGAPLPEWPDEPVPITDEDIDDAVEWARKLDPEIWAMLQAKTDEANARA